MNKSRNGKKTKKRKKAKGFTLVELLVTISILGLITAMSIPVIRNIIEANTLKKYTTYKDSVESSAKLYVDSYSEDLFGKNKSGCAYITYDQMKDKNLIKNIQENNVSCDSDKTYVRVVKLNGKYTYATQIGCGNSSGNEKIASSKVNVLYPESGVPRNETCSYDAVTKLSVRVSPYEKYEKTDKKKYALNIILESFTGINNGVQVSYAWHKEGTDSSKDVWQDATFRSMSSSKQEEQILNGQTITLKSSEILTPDKETGSYKLLVKINNAMDITGTNLITDLNKTVTFGTYKIDNLPPVINSLSVSSTNQSYNTLKAKVNINATDNNMLSSQNDVKVCIKTNTSSCSSNDYKAYASSYDITLPGGKYDGSKKTVYVYVKDNAGNVTSKTVDYTLYKECSTSILDSNNLKEKGTCSKKCGGGTRLDTYGKKDKYTGVQCSGTAKKQETCNTMECCSKTDKEPQSWVGWSTCSASCGGGSQSRSRTVIYKSAYDSSIECKRETENETQSCNTMGCCSKTNKEPQAWSGWSTCSKSCGGGTQSHSRTVIYKSAYNSNIECDRKTETENQSCNTMGCCSKTTASPGAWSGWSACSKTCGSGSQSQTRTVVYKSAYDSNIECDRKTESQSQSCNTQSCVSVKVLKKSAYICPEDQNKPTREQCVGGQYNALNVTSVSVSGTSVKVQGYLVNNSFYITWNASDAARTVCIADSSNTCKKKLSSFSIANQNYAGAGAHFASFNTTVDVKNWPAGKYRIIVKSGGSPMWRIQTTGYMVDLFQVKK